MSFPSHVVNGCTLEVVLCQRNEPNLPARVLVDSPSGFSVARPKPYCVAQDVELVTKGWAEVWPDIGDEGDVGCWEEHACRARCVDSPTAQLTMTSEEHEDIVLNNKYGGE